MNMKRDVFDKLAQWKSSSRRKPLIINGARQVGKTYSLKLFGETHYEKVVYLNFEKNEKLCSYFDNTLDPKQLLKVLSIHSNVQITPANTLLIFDEIQECPKALNSLKYFCEEANEYHIACAGSLLGVKVSQEKGFPVGKVNFLNLFPMTFYEFLSGIGETQLCSFVQDYDSCDPLPIPLHEKLLHYLRFYFFIGGMPEVVADYIKNENLQIVREIQQEILFSYERDFAKHAPPHEVMNITTVWQTIHQQLAKENKKFIFSAIKKSARGRDYEAAIQWLLDAGLIYKCYQLSSPKFPLSAYAKSNIFKIYLIDIGLLGAHSNLSSKTIISGNTLFTEFKGSLTENFITQELLASLGHQPYYWASEGSAEVDFLIELEQEIYPLEVKAGNNSKKKSLLVYQNKYHPSKLFRATTMNLKEDNKLVNLPLYMIANLPRCGYTSNVNS
jgi:uncharacterized protein